MIRNPRGASRARMAAACTFAVLLWLPASLPAQGMMPGGGMRDMMRQMMRGAVPPPGMTAERLPEPESDGARLVLRFCQQCHDLPSPRYKTAGQWPDVFSRMAERMRMMTGGMMGGGMMMGRIEAPSLAESRTLLAYLIRNSMIPARGAELDAMAPADRAAFSEVCARCHALPSPSLHPPPDWPGVVARMQGNMLAMDRPQPTAPQLDAILRALQTTARAN